MLLHITEILGAQQALVYRTELEKTGWADGRITAGFQSALAKHNQQLPEDHPLARRISGDIVSALEKNPLFMGAALPLRVFPPLFNRYDEGQSFDTHVDND
jgi:PKHD-type hydroxylase